MKPLWGGATGAGGAEECEEHLCQRERTWGGPWENSVEDWPAVLTATVGKVRRGMTEEWLTEMKLMLCR